MSIHVRIRRAVVDALRNRPPGAAPTCTTCRGVRLVIQITPDLHDRWAIEARAITRRHVHTITHYEGIPVHQLPNLAPGTAQVVPCWECLEIPPVPDDPDALARFLS